MKATNINVNQPPLNGDGISERLLFYSSTQKKWYFGMCYKFSNKLEFELEGTGKVGQITHWTDIDKPI